MVKDILYSVIICGVVLGGSYLLDNHHDVYDDRDMFFSYVLTSLMFLSFAAATGIAFLFALQRYFNRFLYTLIATMLIASNISFVLDGQVSSLSKYFESWPAFLSMVALLALVILLIGRIVVGVKGKGKPQN